MLPLAICFFRLQLEFPVGRNMSTIIGNNIAYFLTFINRRVLAGLNRNPLTGFSTSPFERNH
jgi:hypothetical protein